MKPISTNDFDAAIHVGLIETDIPIPTSRSKPLTAAQKRLLELPIGGSFTLTPTAESGRSSQWEANNLHAFARAHGRKISVREVVHNTHRIWRTA